jgi:non-reducing end alpha-L-arabinofuranosidase
MKEMRSILLASLAAASIAVIPVACSSYSSGESTTPSSTGGTGGSSDTSSSGGSGGSSSCSAESTSTAVPPAPAPEDMPLPCGVIADDPGDAKCATAHSTVRVIVPGYSGALYQLCKGGSSPGPSSCKGTTVDIMPKDGYADVDAHEEFCGTEACTITKIYDQSGNGNDLEPAPKGGAKATPDNPAKAMALPVKVNGHKAYAILIKAGMGYRTGCNACNIKQGKGMAKGDEPQSMYMVTCGNKDLIDGCCFDYGNAETTSNDDGNGTMEAIYFGGGVVWGTGKGGKPGPWVMADLENGVFAGWENKQDKNISTNPPMKFDFVTAVVIGDTTEKNCGKGRFALYGGDATGKDSTYGNLACLYDGIRPEKSGYNPMQKQGSLILGTGGDNSSGGGGRFYEGATATGPLISKETIGKLQAAIVAAKYEVVPIE